MVLAARATVVPEPYVVPPSQQFDGNDGSWSTFKISVGTPGQDFRVLPSTNGGITYLVAPDGCIEGVDPVDCPKLRGAEIFNSAQNIGYQTNISTSWEELGQYDVALEEGLNYTSKGLFGYDNVSLGPASDNTSVSLDHQVVAGIGDLDYFMGILPLGQSDASFSRLGESIHSFLYQLRDDHKIPSLSYAYTAGAKYRFKSVLGSLILGGYDTSRFTENRYDFFLSFSTEPNRLLSVGVESIIGQGTLKGTYSLTTGAHFTVIDSTVPHLWLPQSVCDSFEEAFGLTYDPHTDLYLVNDTIHNELLSRNPTITIKLVNSVQATTTNFTNIVLPYAAFDLQASYPYYENATNYFPIRRAANQTQYTLGRTLLQEAYLIVDYEEGKFTIAQAAFSDPLPNPSIVPILSANAGQSSDNTKSSDLSTGAVVGIAAAGAVVFVFAIFAFFYYRKRRTPKNPYELASENQVAEHGSMPNLAAPRASLKPALGPQELSGTPLNELASPYMMVPPSELPTPTSDHFNHGFPQDRKTVISMNDAPVELPAEPPVLPRWQEVHLPLRPPNRYEIDAEASSDPRSWAPSDVEHPTTGEVGLRSGVSPLTAHFQQSYQAPR